MANGEDEKDPFARFRDPASAPLPGVKPDDGRKVPTGDSKFWKDFQDWAATRAINAVTGAPALPSGILDMAALAGSDVTEAVTGKKVPQSVIRTAMKNVPTPLTSPWFDPMANMANTAKAKAQEIVPPVNAPASMGGPYADAAAEALLGGAPFSTIGMRTIPQVVRAGVLDAASGVGGEAAGQATAGSRFEPYARAAGGSLPSAPVNIPLAMRNPAARLAREATRDLKPEDWAKGRQRQVTAADLGVDLMAHEAVAPNQYSPLVQLMGDVAASPQGAKIRTKASERIPGIYGAIDKVAGQIAPPITDKLKTGYDIGEAAGGVVRAPKDVRTAKAQPGYQASEGVDLDPSISRSVVDKIDEAIAGVNPKGAAKARLMEIRSLLVTPGHRPDRKMDDDIASMKLPDATKNRMMKERLDKEATPPVYQTNIGKLDEAFKEMEHVLSARAYEPTTRVTERARVKTDPVLEKLRADMMAANDEYRRAVEVYRGTVDPKTGQLIPSPESEAVKAAQRSASGQIAAKGDAGPAEQFGAFQTYVMDPKNTTAQAAVKSIRDLKGQNPEAVKNALVQHIEDYAEASKKQAQSGPGPSPYAGGKFASKIGGEGTDRRAILLGTIGEAAGQPAAAGMTKLLDILDRTGMTPGMGSPTHTRGETKAESGRGGPTQAVLGTLDISRGSLPGQIREANLGWRQRRTYRQLADIVTDPQGVKKLHELAMLDPNSARARALAQSIWQGINATED